MKKQEYCELYRRVLVKFVIIERGWWPVQLNEGRMLGDGGIVITSCLRGDDVIVVDKVQHRSLDRTPVVGRLEGLRLGLQGKLII